MDTTANTDQAERELMKRIVEARLAEIKAHMPLTYEAIQDKAREIGNQAYNFVRRGVAGQPNAFFAVEAGRSVGTPFVDVAVGAEQLAGYIRQFGCKFLILWAADAQKREATDGTH